MILPWAKGLLRLKDHAYTSEAMWVSGSPCLSQTPVLPPPSDFGLAILPRHVCRPCGPGPHLGSSRLSVRWNPTIEVYESTGRERCIESLQTCLASNQSPKHPEAATQRSLWPLLISRPLIYTSNFSDVNPIQLSELWLQTLRVKRDPKKIVKALRHSFAFIIVLAEDDNATSTTGSRLKTVGVGRAISDGSFIATICDVAVDPAYRHRGIGRRIVKKLVENMKRNGGPSGFAVFPPPRARRFFWMIGFRSDRAYKLMAYRGETEDKITDSDSTSSPESEGGLVEIQ